MLTKEQILQADDIKTKVIKVPEWKGEVTIRMLTAEERDQLETIAYPVSEDKKAMPRENVRALWCVFSIIGDDGKRVFTKDDIDNLGKKSSSALDRIFTAALKLNKVSEKDIEEMEKNSEAAPAAGSTLS